MRSDTRNAYAEPAFAVLGAALLYFVRFGYDFGRSDQDEFLPYLLSRLHPGLLSHDWFVQTQTAGFNVRTYFVGLLEGLASLMPVWLAVLLVYAVTWFMIAAAVYALANVLTGDRLAATATVFLALVLTPQWTLGGNDLVHRMLVPSMPAWGLGLWGTVALLTRRTRRGAALLGLATWMQALVGLHLALLLGTVLLLRCLKASERAEALHRLRRFAGFYVLFAAPALLPLLYDQLTATASPEPGTPSRFYILAAFRAPHHYLPSSFSAHAAERFGLLAAGGLLALAFPPVRKMLRHLPFVGLVLALIAVACSLGLLFTEAWPVLLVTKLQLFKTTVLAKVLFLIILGAAGSLLLPTGLWKRISGLLATPWPPLLALAGWTFLFVGLITQKEFVLARLHPLAHQEEALAQVERWARTQTPEEAIFAVPPSIDSFRAGARRGIVVNFKAYPFRDALMDEWYRRLTDLAPIRPPVRGGAAVLPHLDAAYEGLSADELRRLAGTYGFTYVVRRTRLPWPHRGLAEVFRHGTWTVYRVLPDGP
ncbi:hypothetical protein GQ464_015755 [Rhodocaloribacter litoris]|uniref:DUF6798 domain-containing protein n=1 Tax=Rhodocaloribacter litoris TaxID=2558931 RepID=UPI001420F6BE|nr:DUF6798 domain-containing protein [Rhodocaloribacter litoris]QXD14856.1 hypothetical protein GQ464_015755 [Rhodocaloribacter litoris]GIV59048.1 MAG: hypothetical protein KatS3mg043_0137 [Rhodothermaceae bacterium]